MVEDDISADSQDEKMTRHHSSSPPSPRHTTPLKAAQTPSPTCPFTPDDKKYNRTVKQIRYEIERVIANTQGPGRSCIPATEDHRKIFR